MRLLASCPTPSLKEFKKWATEKNWGFHLVCMKFRFKLMHQNKLYFCGYLHRKPKPYSLRCICISISVSQNLIYLSIYLSSVYLVYMALQSFVGPWPLFQFLNLHTLGSTSWKRVSPLYGRYLYREHHKHRINAHRHIFFEWDSNPWSQRSSERRQFTPETARPLW
jgi:hypothetical protein